MVQTLHVVVQAVHVYSSGGPCHSSDGPCKSLGSHVYSLGGPCHSSGGPCRISSYTNYFFIILFMRFHNKTITKQYFVLIHKQIYFHKPNKKIQ